MKNLYIIGAGGFGREVAWLTERINTVTLTWNIKGFIDDNESLWGCKIDDYEVFGGCNWLKEVALNEEIYVVCAIGNSAIRKKIICELKNSNIKFATLVDPSVLISNRVKVGEGSIICAGTIITMDIEIGNHVIINLNCTLGHDDIVRDYVTINPGVSISGNVEIGACSELGTGSQIIQGINVVGQTIVGAGAVVVKEITERGTYVGVPAKVIKYKDV